MNIKLFKTTVFALCSIMLFTACGASNGSSQSAQSAEVETQTDSNTKETAVFADTQGPTSLDPAESWNSWYTSRYGITETLYKLDDSLVPQPLLALSCEMTDDTTWVITLRDDVTFQNGEKMTAESVKACWERTLSKNPRLGELLFISQIEASGQSLTVKTTEPVPAFINGLTEPLSAVYYVTDDESIAQTPIGTGPFKAVSYEVNKQANVERYDSYWGGTPKLKSAVFNIISDTNSLVMAQQTGESDLSVSIPGTSLELFNDASKYNVDGVAGSRGQVIFMNYNNEFIQDINIRKAISMCINKQGYAEILNKGASVPTNGLYPDFMDFGSKEDLTGGYDIEGAKKVLSDAGYTDTNGDGIVEKDGKPVSLRIATYSTKAELSMFCEEMASSLKEVGIDLKVEVYESVAEQQKTGDFDLLMVSFTMCPTGDPLYFANIAFKTNGSSNYGHYSNAEVDSIINQMTREFDAEKRTELAKEVQKLVCEDVGYIVVGHSKYVYVMNSSVKGLKTNPSEYYLLDANTYIE